MEYLEVLNAVNDAMLEVNQIVEFEMKQHRRSIELSKDKKTEIKSIIKSFDYTASIVGHGYINTNYWAGNDDIEVRENLTRYYLRMKHRLKFDSIKEDAKDFLILYRQELELRKMLNGDIGKIPEELDNPKAKELLQKAIQVGLCDENYKWLREDNLLAYFSSKASLYLKLGKGEHNGKPKISWQPFEKLFGITNLRGSEKDYSRYGGLPSASHIVDKLFQE